MDPSVITLEECLERCKEGDLILINDGVITVLTEEIPAASIADRDG